MRSYRILGNAKFPGCVSIGARMKSSIKWLLLFGLLMVMGMTFTPVGIRSAVCVIPISVGVQIELIQLGQAMSLYALNHGPTDWPNVDAMLFDVQQDGTYTVSPRLEHGFDIWGSKILLIKDKGNKRWILRSYGPNRQDDNGEGDDIQEDLQGTW